MRRVIRTSLTIAMATAMIGVAVSQARADRVSYSVDRCFGAGCVGGSVRVGELSLAFTESGLGVVDPAASATALANFSPELGGISGVSFAGSSLRTQVGEAGAVQRTDKTSPAASVLLPVSGLSMSFSRVQEPAFAASVNLGRSVSTASNNGSFSLAGAALKITRPYTANDASIGGIGDTELPPGGTPPNATPEPTTMLLLGTGLVGFAAIARKRLRGKRESK